MNLLLRYIFLVSAFVLAPVLQAAPPLDGVPQADWGYSLPGVSTAKFGVLDYSVTQDLVTLTDGSSIFAVSYLDNDQEWVGLVRLDPSGKPQAGFGTGGYAKTGVAGNTFSSDDELMNRVFLRSGGAGDLFFAVITLDEEFVPTTHVCRANAANGALMPFAPTKPSCVEINQHIVMNLFVQADGKLLVVALQDNGTGIEIDDSDSGSKTEGLGVPNRNFHVIRLNTNGTVDASYGVGGTATITMPPGDVYPFAPAALAANGKLVVSIFHEEFGSRLRRLTDQGVVDAGWPTESPLPGVTDFVIYDLLTETRSGGGEDDVVMLGASQSGFIARLRGSNGKRDVSFGAELDTPEAVFSRMVARPGGGYFLALGAMGGAFFGLEVSEGPMTVLALDRQGRLDLNFGTNGVVNVSNPFSNASYSSALSYRNGALFVVGGTYFSSADEFAWLEVKLGIDRIFADDFENPDDGG